MRGQGAFLETFTFKLVATGDKQSHRQQTAMGKLYFMMSFNPISTCILSSLFSVYFLCYWLGEFDKTSRHFMTGNHFLYSHDLYI